MNKAFQLITSVNIGGAENIALSIIEGIGLPNRNLNEMMVVEIIRTRSKYADKLRKALSEAGVKIISLSKAPKWIALLLAPIMLYLLIRKEKPKLIHCHTDLPDFALATAINLMKLSKTKRPRILRTIHNVHLWPTHPLIAKYTESSINDDAIIAVSHAALQAYVKLRGDCQLPLAKDKGVIYNGCKVPIARENEFIINNQRWNICFCGRFDPQKGVDYLCDTIRKINSIKRFDNCFEFHAIGDGPQKSMLAKLANEYPNVHLHGPILDASGVFHCFDYILMPSRFEGLGLVSIEAALAKTPVIISNSPGLVETVPTDWPLVFNLNDESALIDIFDKIRLQQFDQKKLGLEIYQFAMSRFSNAKMIESYKEVVQRLMS